MINCVKSEVPPKALFSGFYEISGYQFPDSGLLYTGNLNLTLSKD